MNSFQHQEEKKEDDACVLPTPGLLDKLLEKTAECEVLTKTMTELVEALEDTDSMLESKSIECERLQILNERLQMKLQSLTFQDMEEFIDPEEQMDDYSMYWKREKVTRAVQIREKSQGYGKQLPPEKPLATILSPSIIVEEMLRETTGEKKSRAKSKKKPRQQRLAVTFADDAAEGRRHKGPVCVDDLSEEAGPKSDSKQTISSNKRRGYSRSSSPPSLSGSCNPQSGSPTGRKKVTNSSSSSSKKTASRSRVVTKSRHRSSSSSSLAVPPPHAGAFTKPRTSSGGLYSIPWMNNQTESSNDSPGNSDTDDDDSSSSSSSSSGEDSFEEVRLAV